MPYSNVPDDKIDAMDSCVEKVMAEHSGEEGFTKENAIKICYTRIVGGTDVVVESAGVHFSVVTDPTDVNMVLGQSFKPGELLRWKGAELARAEVNANMDELSNDDIDALASTLPLMPLTDEHDGEVVGLFTAATSEPSEGQPNVMRLMTQGVMYARRFPEVAEAIRNGEKRLSVEAFAEMAVCSMCGSEFTNARDYCVHLRNRHTTGTARRFRGIRAVGGGAVRRPAGSHAGFDHNQVYMIASHQEESPDDDGGSEEIVEGGDNMDRDELQGQLNDALATLEAERAARQAAEDERNGLQERVETLEASVDDLESQLAEARQEAQEARESMVWQERSALLAGSLTEEEIEGQRNTIMAMSEEVLQLFVQVSERRDAPDETTTPTTMTADLGEDGDAVVVALA